METYRNDTGAGFWLQFRNPDTGVRRNLPVNVGESVSLTNAEIGCLLGGRERLGALTRVGSAPTPKPTPAPAPAPVVAPVVEEPDPVVAPAATDDDEEMTKAEIMAALDDLGVEYNARDRKAVLAAALAEAEESD